MSQRFEIDLEQEKIQFDGAWLSAKDIDTRITQMLAAGDRKIGRLADALEQLDQALAGAKSITIKLSAEHHAKLEAAGQKLGKSASAFARDLLIQVLGGGASAQPAPQPAVVPAASAPVILPAPAPAPVIANPAPQASTSSDVTPEEAAQALTMPPKRKDPLPAAPPVMTPVVPGVLGTGAVAPVPTPAAVAPAAPTPSVVVDLSAGNDDKPKAGAPPNDGRRWFNRT